MVDVEKDNDLLYECKDDTQTTPLNLENRNEMELIPEIVTLKEKLENSEKELRKMGELESELQKEREKTKSLNEKIQELQDDSSLTKKLREMRLNTYYLERELKNANIDKRLVDRELKDVNEVNNQLVKQLEMQKNKMKEDKKNHEVALLELNSMNESFSIEIIKLKDKEKTLQILMHEDDKIKDNLNKLIKDLTFVNGVKEKTLERLHSELKDMKAKLDQYRNENIKRAEELDILNKEKVDLQNRLSNAEREHQQFHSKFLALGEACVLLENQLITLEKLNETYNTERKTFNSKLETLTSELRTAKEEIEQAEQFANQEKSSKLDAEMKVQRMEEVIELLKVENEDYKKKLSKNEEFSDTLSEQIIMDEEEITNLQISLRFSEGQIKDLVMENRRLKEEASDYITRFHNTKQMNYELNRQVNELKENNNLLKAHVHDLDCVLKEKNSYYKEQKIKADATSKQQIKLIDYLQTKIEESQNKKKSFTLFGHSKKENLPPISQPINHKDMEFQLHYDRSKQTPNRRKSDVSRKTKIETQKLVQSSSSQSKNFPRKNSLQRMQHNIPHRFESKLCTKSTKCEHCLNTIVLGRNMSVCKECRISTHSNCSATFASSCGLPLEEVNVYQNITFETTSTSQNATTSKGNANVESTIKIFGQSGSWENRYAVLTNTHLKVYAEKSERYTSNPEQIFELKSEGGHGKVLLEPLKSEIDVIVADNDLPFLIKLEISPHTTCWPSKAFIFLTLSIQDRDMWYKALQKLYQKDNGNLFCETIMTLPEGLTVNCVLDLNENTKAVGTTKGLFCCYKGDLVFVEGFVEVHQMALMPLTKIIAMIVNAKNVLITCYLDHLINVAQYKAYLAKINFKYDVVDVKGLNGFHLLESCKEGGHKMFCVATPKQLIIMRYDEKEEKFLPLRILDTAEPTGTILFTDSSIIVGADKFFKIDLATFIAEEFLDESNPQLQNILKSYNTRMKPYPLSVVEVSDNPREYLVSFNEFSIFVDENGNPSRKRQWTFKHLPLGVFYVQQHLYVVEFCAVELRSITVDTCASEQEEQHESDVSRIKLNNFQFVGTNERGIYVCHKNAIELIEGRRCIPTNDSSLLETENTDDSSGRFSFSASMFQSLDGHLDLNIPDEENVTFTQTSL